MPKRPRRSPEARRSRPIMVLLTAQEASDLRADADRLHEGNVSALLRAAWRQYRRANAREEAS